MEANANPVSFINDSRCLIKRWSLHGSVLGFLFTYPLGIGLSIIHTKTLIESLIQGSKSHIIQLAQQPEGWVDVSRFLKGFLNGDLIQGIRIVDPKNGFALVQMERESESILRKIEPSFTWDIGLFVGDREYEMNLNYSVPLLLVTVVCFVLALCSYMVFNLSSYRLINLLRVTARDISGLLEKIAASARTEPLRYDAKVEEVATLQNAYNAFLNRVSTAESNRLHDLAEKMRLEERTVANKNLIDILQAAIHDFKSPIGTFRRYLEIQKDMKPPHRNALESAQVRMEEIIAEMSQKEKELIDRRKQDLKKVTILEFIAEKVVQEKKFSFNAISIDYEPGNLLSPAAIDGQCFERILVNLIDNAIDACDREDSHVCVSFDRSALNEIQVVVEDNGRGISPAILPRLFQKGATFEKKNGQGLGLFSARQILTDLGSRIHLESQVGVGTKAVLTLPVASSTRILRALPDLSGQIAVLDDDPLIHSLVDQAFSGAVSVEHFDSPDAFSDWTRANTASGFLIDMNLGSHTEESGLDVIEREAIQRNAVLVTNDFDCVNVLARAGKLAVPVFPKPLLAKLAVARVSEQTGTILNSICALDSV